MDFYNATPERYFELINKPVIYTRLKVELMDHQENTFAEIEQDIDSSSVGNIVSNNEQGTRKSCSFTLINVDKKYTIDENNFFWFNRKFRLHLGIYDVEEGDKYWFTKGVFITQSANCDSVASTVSIEGCDKYGQLDGTLNVLQLDEMNTVIEANALVGNVIRDILMLDIGNGEPLDPIEPIIDPDIANSTLYQEYTLSAGQYYGDFLAEVMTAFGCDIYYDNMGRLVVKRIFNDEMPYWYSFKGAAHYFNRNFKGYQNPSLSDILNGVNKVIVTTDNTETENYTYTAINHNPRSPLCYDKIGARTLTENGGVITINIGDPDKGDVKTKCRDYANYRLMQETRFATTVSFSCPPYFHLCEDDIVILTDEQYGLYEESFIINSISYPLDQGELSIEASALKNFPTDIYLDSKYTSLNKYEIKYIISYDLNGGSGTTPASTSVSDNTKFVAALGYDTTNNVDLFYNTDENYEFNYYEDSVDGTIYYPDVKYWCDNRDQVLNVNWRDVSDNILSVRINDCDVGRNMTIFSLAESSASPVIDCCKVNSKKYYFRSPLIGVGEYVSYYPITVESTMQLYYKISGSYFTTNLGNYLGFFDSGFGGTAYSIVFPKSITSLDLSNSGAGLKFSYFTLPERLRYLTVGANTLYNWGNLKEIELAKNNQLNISYNSNNTVQFLASCSNLTDITATYPIEVSGSGSGRINFIYSLRARNVSLEDITVYNTNLIVGNNDTGIDSGKYYVNGDLIAYNSQVFVGLNLSATDSLVECNEVALISSTFMQGGYISKCNFKGNITANQSSGFMTGLTVGNPVVFKGNVTMDRPSGDNFVSTASSSMTFEKDFVYTAGSSSSANLFLAMNIPTINFYGKVSITDSSSKSNMYFAYCSSLTDIYFYDDNVDFNITNSNATVFSGRNANLKIHGIANGNAQALAETYGITFEEIE